MMPLIAALAMLVPTPQDLSGLYRTHQMEVGAALQLNADGTFQYSLDYGAVSEAGEGHWTAKDGVVHLTSDPMPFDLLSQIERSDAAFRDEALPLDGGALVLHRWDTLFTFTKEDE